MRFDLAVIMRTAWGRYRTYRLGVFAAGDDTGHRCFLRAIFAKALAAAWAEAKKALDASCRRQREQELARQLVERLHATRAARIAMMTTQERAARLSGVKDELELLDYAPWGVRVSDRRGELRTELAALELSFREAPGEQTAA